MTLSFGRGLCVLSGETGSGKSILLDALGLVVGSKTSNMIKMLKDKERTGSVVASFNVSKNVECLNLLREHEINADENLVVRRVICTDGKSKAFVNDVQVTQTFLQSVGELLVEIHGQHEQIGLLNPSLHLAIIDEFGALEGKRNEVSLIFEQIKASKKKISALLEQQNDLVREQDYLKHILSEFESLNPHDGEEEELSNKRIAMMNKEKILTLLNDVKNYIDGQTNLSKNITLAQHALSKGARLGDGLFRDSHNPFDEIIDTLEQANNNVCEASHKIDTIMDSLDFDGQDLEHIEERLFALRALARKLNVSPDMLCGLKATLEQKLNTLNGQESDMLNEQQELKRLTDIFITKATELRKLRKDAAEQLSTQLIAELAPLRMEKTIFSVKFTELSEDNWNKNGMDSAKFLASTNPGIPPDELSKIASGGELSRFMLALRVVLSRKTHISATMVFDEIDADIGGATAEAVGTELKQLGQSSQVLVVTHQAQVASKADYHIKIKKEHTNNTTTVRAEVLQGEDRVKEIARMFSGETITDEALSVARKMIKL